MEREKTKPVRSTFFETTEQSSTVDENYLVNLHMQLQCGLHALSTGTAILLPVIKAHITQAEISTAPSSANLALPIKKP